MRVCVCACVACREGLYSSCRDAEYATGGEDWGRRREEGGGRRERREVGKKTPHINYGALVVVGSKPEPILLTLRSTARYRAAVKRHGLCLDLVIPRTSTSPSEPHPHPHPHTHTHTLAHVATGNSDA